MKLWAYLALARTRLKASGPITGSSSSLPKVTFRPVMAEHDERDRGEPMHEALEGPEAQHLASRSPGRDAEPSEEEIGPASAAIVPRITIAPSQCNSDLVKMIPVRPAG